MYNYRGITLISIVALEVREAALPRDGMRCEVGGSGEGCEEGVGESRS